MWYYPTKKLPGIRFSCFSWWIWWKWRTYALTGLTLSVIFQMLTKYANSSDLRWEVWVPIWRLWVRKWYKFHGETSEIRGIPRCGQISIFPSVGAVQIPNEKASINLSPGSPLWRTHSGERVRVRVRVSVCAVHR